MRARGLLAHGVPLVRSLRGHARLAVAAYVGGGRAALDAVEASGFDVLARIPSAGGRARGARDARRPPGGAVNVERPTHTASRSPARARRASTACGSSVERRAALFAVYAFAWRIDDIADGDLPAAEKVRQLHAARAVAAPGRRRRVPC